MLLEDADVRLLLRWAVRVYWQRLNMNMDRENAVGAARGDVGRSVPIQVIVLASREGAARFGEEDFVVRRGTESGGAREVKEEVRLRPLFGEDRQVASAVGKEVCGDQRERRIQKGERFHCTRLETKSVPAQLEELDAVVLVARDRHVVDLVPVVIKGDQVAPVVGLPCEGQERSDVAILPLVPHNQLEFRGGRDEEALRLPGERRHRGNR